jgi:serine-type D-Ala-D-Ala carboxypeptidase/endopeptidase
VRSIERPTGTPELDVAMAWHLLKKYGAQLVWHNGGTYGYRSFASFDPATKQGVVILCNTFLDNDDLGHHILESRWARASPSRRIA